MVHGIHELGELVEAEISYVEIGQALGQTVSQPAGRHPAVLVGELVQNRVQGIGDTFQVPLLLSLAFAFGSCLVLGFPASRLAAAASSSL